MAVKTPVLTIQGILTQMVQQVPATSTTQDQLDRLEKTLKALNPKKFFAFEAPTTEIEELQRKLAMGKKCLQMSRLGYPHVDYSFLSWQKKDSKLPAFIVLSLESNEFSITVEPTDEDEIQWNTIIRTIKPDLPDLLLEQYDKAVLELGQLSAKQYDCEEIEIAAKYRGIMPTEVRNKVIAVLKEKLFDHIFVICEAPVWTIRKTGKTSLADPLVVGWDEETGLMFLIASYDPTSLEKYIQEQFVI